MRLERKRVWLSSILKNENHYALLTSFGFSAYMLSEESIGVPGSDPLDGRQTMVAPLEALAPPVGVPRKSVGKDLVVRADGQLSRGLSIIECLSVFSSLTTEQLSVKTGIPKSSVYRILGILESFNYVSKSKVELEDVLEP